MASTAATSGGAHAKRVRPAGAPVAVTLMCVSAHAALNGVARGCRWAASAPSAATPAGEGLPLGDWVVRPVRDPVAHGDGGRLFAAAVLAEYEPASRRLSC